MTSDYLILAVLCITCVQVTTHFECRDEFGTIWTVPIAPQKADPQNWPESNIPLKPQEPPVEVQ
jgi:hypothetical protein